MLAPRRVETRRLSAEYVEAGEGRAVVLLHGNFATWRWWRAVLEAGVPGARLIAPSMRGCVGTRGGARAGTYDIASLSEDVLSLADALGVERMDVVGHSLGGALALECALRAPARITGLHLVASAPGDALESMREHLGATTSILDRFDPRKSLDRAALLTALRLGRDLGTNRRWLRTMLTQLMPRADLAAVDFERLLADAARMEPVAIVQLYRALSTWDVRAQRREVQVPVRVLAGREDALVPVRALEAFCAELARGELEVLECGHSPMLERPEAFQQWLAAGVAPAQAPVPPPAPVVAVAIPPTPVQIVPAAPLERPTVWARLRAWWSAIWARLRPA